jgi:GMP synthase (glutamine-hydrolysing)
MTRYLLLQARNPGDPSGPHEFEAFQEILQLGPEAFRVWSLLEGRPPGRVMDEVDCVLVGGSGEYGMGDAAQHSWLGEFTDLMGDLADRGFPTFASCFGFQALCLAMGGKVEADKSRAEVGTFQLYVTDDGAADPLFGPLKPTFLAQLGHKDHVTELPDGVVHLAGSDRSPHQALKIPDKPVYATQFPPELSMKRNRERFLEYIDSYADPDMPDPPEKVLAAYRETQAASGVLKRFADEILPRFLG